MKNYNNRVLPTRLPLGYSSPFKDTFYYVGPGTIFIFGLGSIVFSRCVPGYKTRSYLFSTPRIRRESIRREPALLSSWAVTPPQGSPVAAPIAMSVAGRKYHYPLRWSPHIEVAIFLLDPWCYRSPIWGLGAPVLHAYGFADISGKVPDDPLFSCQGEVLSLLQGLFAAKITSVSDCFCKRTRIDSEIPFC